MDIILKGATVIKASDVLMVLTIHIIFNSGREKLPTQKIVSPSKTHPQIQAK